MARRGQTYGVRTDNPNDGRIDNKPDKNVGLLFMAFNSDIGKQFEVTQKNWANNPGLPASLPGFSHQVSIPLSVRRRTTGHGRTWRVRLNGAILLP